jgi:hypothetical protein
MCSCDEVFCESLSLRLLLLFLTFNNTSQTFNLADHI